MPSFSPKYRLQKLSCADYKKAISRAERLTSAPDSIGLAMVPLALTFGLIVLLAIVKVVLERSDYQARDQDDWT
jgi:hypothetical protein